MKFCGKVIRGGECKLDHNHNGPCSTKVWCCDGCGRMRRGRPYATGEEGLGFCFVCCKEATRNNYVNQGE